MRNRTRTGLVGDNEQAAVSKKVRTSRKRLAPLTYIAAANPRFEYEPAGTLVQLVLPVAGATAVGKQGGGGQRWPTMPPPLELTHGITERAVRPSRLLLRGSEPAALAFLTAAKGGVLAWVAGRKGGVEKGSSVGGG